MELAPFRTLGTLVWMLVLISCFVSCESLSTGVAAVADDRPSVPVVRWTHITPAQLEVVNTALVSHGDQPWPLGQVLSDDDFRLLAQWIVEERAYVHELERLIGHYDPVPVVFRPCPSSTGTGSLFGSDRATPFLHLNLGIPPPEPAGSLDYL